MPCYVRAARFSAPSQLPLLAAVVYSGCSLVDAQARWLARICLSATYSASPQSQRHQVPDALGGGRLAAQIERTDGRPLVLWTVALALNTAVATRCRRP